MTEAEWLTTADPLAVTDWLFFDGVASDRKLRLFSVACCHPVMIHLGRFAPSAGRLVALTEAFADGLILPVMLNQAREALLGEWQAYDDEHGRRYRESQARGGAADVGSDAEVVFWFVSQCGVRAAIFGMSCAEELNRLDCQYRQRQFYQGPDRRAFPFAAAAEAAEAIVMAVDVDDESAREQARSETERYQLHLLHDIFGNPFRLVALDPAWVTPEVVALAKGIYEDRAFDRMPLLADALQDADCDHDEILNHCRQPGEHVRGCWVVDMILGKQ